MTSAIAISHGPALVGVFVSCMLYGSMVTQVYYYSTRFRSDPTWMRCFVYFLFIMDSISTIFAIWWIYDLVVNNFGNIAAFGVTNWLFIMDPMCIAIIATACQLFFARRVKILTGKVWLGALVAASSITCGLCTLGTVIGLTMVTSMAEFHRLDPIIYPWLVSSAFVDVMTALILTHHLRKHFGGFRRTEMLVNKLVRLTIANGLFTALSALMEFILFIASPNTGVHILFSFLIPKLYTNSVLSSLNQRPSESGSEVYTSSKSGPTVPPTNIQLRSTNMRRVRRLYGYHSTCFEFNASHTGCSRCTSQPRLENDGTNFSFTSLTWSLLSIPIHIKSLICHQSQAPIGTTLVLKTPMQRPFNVVFLFPALLELVTYYSDYSLLLS
ncbi:uncharacterized protein EV420DRAFT_520518 [Desarmillaria tabescens]|uniref:DUF6534 domain-containing protein n=1 Tax=Armillaria tabescens TaxID=1929756 RepID=A0AA39N472_ARMTA|nr:uncharacterized protein EV420DRAFT_520518 [Desarmillaria tabescens]KAK0457322.1 hypothetical protein EV420DRAFT_520518 [Desarmillaria tabescens]